MAEQLEVEVDKQFVKYISSLKMNSLPMVFMLGSLLASAAFSSAAAMNAALQLAVFAVVANIPALITGRMSYVDLAWPYGLVTIGLSPLLQGAHCVPMELMAYTQSVWCILQVKRQSEIGLVLAPSH